MLKGALQWSVYPRRTGSIYRRLWQPLQISPCMLVLILPTPGGWKAEWTLAGKKVTQIFNPRPGRESNRGPQDWEAEILTTAPTPPLYSSQLFKLANILEFFDLVTFHVSIFMFKFHNKLLPAVFDNYFLLTSKVHNYNTRLSSNHAYSLPTARTNYRIFNIRFTGAKVWNSIEAKFKNLSFKAFKARLKKQFCFKVLSSASLYYIRQ